MRRAASRTSLLRVCSRRLLMYREALVTLIGYPYYYMRSNISFAT